MYTIILIYIFINLARSLHIIFLLIMLVCISIYYLLFDCDQIKGDSKIVFVDTFSTCSHGSLLLTSLGICSNGTLAQRLFLYLSCTPCSGLFSLFFLYHLLTVHIFTICNLLDVYLKSIIQD